MNNQFSIIQIKNPLEKYTKDVIHDAIRSIFDGLEGYSVESESIIQTEPLMSSSEVIATKMAEFKTESILAAKFPKAFEVAYEKNRRKCL